MWPNRAPEDAGIPLPADGSRATGQRDINGESVLETCEDGEAWSML